MKGQARTVCAERRPVFRAENGVGGGSARENRHRTSVRGGLILVVVLVVLVLLALLAASFTFGVRADMSAAYARQQSFQARMAAEAGVQRAIVELRTSRGNVEQWYDNPAVFRQAPLQQVAGSETFQTYDRREPSEREEESSKQPNPIWRFTLYATEMDEEQNPIIRYGLTPETGKLDLNAASEEQLRFLFEAAIERQTPDQKTVDIDALVQSLLDWREPGAVPRPKGAKDDYYQSLRPPYRAKKGRFDTVEELLMIKGFTAWVVFGEDYNRNGLLDPNEDDGDASFPPDNADGILYRGVAPFLTVWSREMNIDSEALPRINLNMRDVAKLEELLGERRINSTLVDYILRIRSGGLTFRTVMDLLPVPGGEEEEEVRRPSTAEELQQQEERAEQEQQEDDEEETTQPADEESTTQPATQPTTQPRDRRRQDQPLSNLTDEIPPGTYNDLPEILDRLTTIPVPALGGRINVITASRPVLLTIADFTEAEVDAILSARTGLSGDDKTTPAWLLTQGLISERKFRRVLGRMTSQSSTFTIDSLGFADHVGITRRLQTVLEMRGPIGQVLYYRDLTSLGPAYTPHSEERRGLTVRTRR